MIQRLTHPDGSTPPAVDSPVCLPIGSPVSSPVYSMTGFAAVQGEMAGGAAFALTVKGVNHRFLDLSLRLPPGCDGLEAPLRAAVKQAIKRGHVDVTVQIARTGDAAGQLQLNRELLAAHIAAFREASALHGIGGEPELNAMLRQPGVLRMEGIGPVDPGTLREAVLALLPAALRRFNEARAAEGAALSAELATAIGRVQTATAEVAVLRTGMRSALAGRLAARIQELVGDAVLPADRILAEAALIAERSDVEEELARLDTHTARFLALLRAGGEAGKQLDFLLQELNREANTLLSKTATASAGGLRITELGLEMKHEIEKAREQVQNIE